MQRFAVRVRPTNGRPQYEQMHSNGPSRRSSFIARAVSASPLARAPAATPMRPATTGSTTVWGPR